MALLATMFRDDRSADRHCVNLNGTFRDGASSAFDTSVQDLSSSGFRTHNVAKLTPNEIVSLGLPGIGKRRARVVHEHDGSYGCEFLHPLTASELAAALLGQPAAPVALSSWRVSEHSPFDLPEPSVERPSTGVRRIAVAGLVVASWAGVLGIVFAIR